MGLFDVLRGVGWCFGWFNDTVVNKEVFMKKVRCIKEMPFCKVGEVFEVDNSGCLVFKTTISYEVDKSVKDGWLEWVEEEKSLELKLEDIFSACSTGTCNNIISKIICTTREHYLAVFDKETKGNNHVNYVDKVRQSLTNA